VAALSLGIGILIGHFAIVKTETITTSKYDYLIGKVGQENYKTFIDSIRAANIEASLK
jgi:hypothetical protein